MTEEETQAAIEKTPGEFPLIDKLPSMMTKPAMLLCAGFAQLLPSYKAAEEITGGYLGMKVSDTYIELVTGYTGGRVYETGKEKSREASENMPLPGSTVLNTKR